MHTASQRRYAQVDVFTDRALRGNPLAVVVDGEGLDEETMQAFARWTQLSETTFLLAPRDPRADYRVRIFTPGGELPFAGHPTLGSASVWLAHGGRARQGGVVVQECGVGLVEVRLDADGVPGRLAFAAPPVRIEAVDAALLARVQAALGVPPPEVLAARWLDNGPRWLGLRLDSWARLRSLAPDHGALRGLAKVGVVANAGDVADGGMRAAIEVRAFAAPIGVNEDPVTGSLNASVAQWLIGEGVLPERYVAAQGLALGRAGRVHLRREAGQVWVGGDVASCIAGHVLL